MASARVWIRLIPALAAVPVLAGITLQAQSEAQAPAAAQQQGDVYYSGSDLFRTYCAVCHGRAARGDGPLAESLKKRPPDLTLFAERNGGTYPSAQVHRIIDGRQQTPGHGTADMPAWGDAFKESRGGLTEEAVKARIEALVRYLESIQQRRARQEDAAAPHAAP